VEFCGYNYLMINFLKFEKTKKKKQQQQQKKPTGE